MLYSFASVSYTHLDVYKRQHLLFIGFSINCIIQKKGGLKWDSSFFYLMLEFLPLVLAFGAVSYTHLDVYKRQVFKTSFIRQIEVDEEQFTKLEEYNMAQIAYMVGLNDSHYFSKCFKQQYGMTPTEYKESRKQNT